MRSFAHRENEKCFRPRHPIVCIIDCIGLMTTLALVALYRPHFTTAVLPIAIALQYLVSVFHHWLTYNECRSKLDRGMIFLVIAATYIPYWAGLLGKQEFTAFQASARGGVVRVRLEGDRVKLGGQAVTVMTGELLV